MIAVGGDSFDGTIPESNRMYCCVAIVKVMIMVR